MLSIYFGDDMDYIYNTSLYFENAYEEEWLEDDFTKELIKDIDKSTVLYPGVIDSPFLGKIPPEKLSGGVKTLILMNHMPNEIFNASNCGDNCAKWILDIGNRKDITIRLGHVMDFGDDFSIHIINDDVTVSTMLELLKYASKYV